MIRLTLRDKLLLGLILPLGLAALVAVGVFRAMDGGREAADRVADSNQTLADIFALGKSLSDAETHHRNFLLTGQAHYLDAFDQARYAFGRSRSMLEFRVAADPAQLARLVTLEKQFDHWIRTEAEPLRTARSQAPPRLHLLAVQARTAILGLRLSERELVDRARPETMARWGHLVGQLRANLIHSRELATGDDDRQALQAMIELVEDYEARVAMALDRSSGNPLMDELETRFDVFYTRLRDAEELIVNRLERVGDNGILGPSRKIFDELIATEEATLANHLRDAQTTLGNSRSWTYMGFGLVLALSLVSAILLSLSIGRPVRAVAKAAMAIANGDFHQRVPVYGKDEIGTMATAFNRMADELSAVMSAQALAQRELTQQVDDLVNQRTREVMTLNTMGEMLQAAATAGEAYAIARTYMNRLLPETCGGLYILNPSRNSLELAAGWAVPELPEIVAPDACWAMRRGQTHEQAGADEHARCAHLAPSPAPVYRCIPLVAHGETLGVLHIAPLTDEAEAATAWLDSTREFNTTVAEHLALALANIRLRESLRNQSIRDPLTGLYNRRYLEETLERELIRARRRGSPLSLVMIDVDHFKRFNDTFGHAAGDAVLEHLGRMLREHFRADDVACRYGGEEFALLMPDTDAARARQRAEDLRDAVAALRVTHGRRTLDPVTLSLGVATYPEHGQAAVELMRVADKALYAAKHAGRDRVALAP